MVRSLLLVCVALAAFSHIQFSSAAGLDVIKTSLTGTITEAKGVIESTKQDVGSIAGALDDHLGVTELVNLLTGLVPDIGQLVADLQLTATDLLKNALSNILNSINALKGAVLNAIPLLNGIVTALGAILQEVINLVNSVLSLVLGILGSLTGQLDTTIKNTLVS